MVSITELREILQKMATADTNDYQSFGHAIQTIKEQAEIGLEKLGAIDDQMGFMENSISDTHDALMQMECMDEIGQVFTALGYAENGLRL